MLLFIDILLQLPKQLQGPFMAAVEKGDIRSMPNRTMPALPRPTPGALLMGDAFNMRHPLTGGGMTVALSDIVLLRDMLRPLHNFQDVSSLCDYLQAFYTRRKVSDSILQSIQFCIFFILRSVVLSCALGVGCPRLKYLCTHIYCPKIFIIKWQELFSLCNNCFSNNQSSLDTKEFSGFETFNY